MNNFPLSCSFLLSSSGTFIKMNATPGQTLDLACVRSQKQIPPQHQNLLVYSIRSPVKEQNIRCTRIYLKACPELCHIHPQLAER